MRVSRPLQDNQETPRENRKEKPDSTLSNTDYFNQSQRFMIDLRNKAGIDR